MSDELDPKLPPGSYTIQATLQERGENNLGSDVYGNRLMNLWTGAASSNVLHFVIPELTCSLRPESTERLEQVERSRVRS